LGIQPSVKLRAVVPPTRGGVDLMSALNTDHWLFGCDATPGIVSVDADNHGRARVWRRGADGSTSLTEQRFPNWFLMTSVDLLAHLPVRSIDAEVVRAAHGDYSWASGTTVVELEGATENDDAYRYLVLTDRLEEIETALVETANKGDGGDAQTLADLRGLVLINQPIEQFLLLTGRTYFNGMRFEDLRRMQFDLETSGLNDERDRIFMVSMRDSSGWSECLDTATLSESELIHTFVNVVHRRDPDILENHNIFAFDLPFLVRRASRLGVPLGIGRDGSEPELETDVFDSGERAEPFLRWRVRGREVIDTQHAVRRYGMVAPNLRRHGLKEAARFFGLARVDREYVPGAEIWSTYQTDPDRIRRYAADDVLEVDGLSQRLMPAAFHLTRVLPRAYERIASDSGAMSLWEPLVVRAYLHEGRAIHAPAPRLQRADAPPADLRLRGVVGSAVQATFPMLLPSVLGDDAIHAANDDLAVVPRLVQALLSLEEGDAGAALARASHAYLAGHGLLSDPEAAGDVSRRAGQYVDRLLDDFAAHGCKIVESDGEQILATTPSEWTLDDQRAIEVDAQRFLPAGVRLDFAEHYQAVYARAPHSRIMLGHEGEVTLVGSSFRPGRLERFGEDFIYRIAPLALTGDLVGVRQTFLSLVHLLRSAEVPLVDLTVLVTLHKSPPQYRRSGTHEEPYEVLLGAGVRSWRVGQRIRYFRARGGELRLLQEGDDISPLEADAEYYVQRLVSFYCQQFAQAFRKEDFSRLFRVPRGSGPFDEADDDLRGIRTVAERLV
jgi:DNA polymerase, archaea type